MLFIKVINDYLHYIESRNYSQSTLTGYKKELSYFNLYLEKKYNGPIYLDEITVEDMEAYLYFKKLKGNSAGSRCRVIYILRSFYKYTAKKELANNIAKKLEPIKTRTKEREYLKEDEIKKVIKAIDKPLIKIVTIFLYNTGCRIGETLNLKLKDLDFKNNLIKIKAGKGNKDRNIFMNQKLKSSLKYYLKNLRKEIKSSKLFATKKSGSLSRVYYNRCLKKAVKNAGINKNITAHSIRHSTAASLLKKKVNLAVIQRLLGHKSLKTTSLYLHSDLSEMKTALQRLEV